MGMKITNSEMENGKANCWNKNLIQNNKLQNGNGISNSKIKITKK